MKTPKTKKRETVEVSPNWYPNFLGTKAQQLFAQVPKSAQWILKKIMLVWFFVATHSFALAQTPDSLAIEKILTPYSPSQLHKILARLTTDNRAKIDSLHFIRGFEKFNEICLHFGSQILRLDDAFLLDLIGRKEEN